MPKTLVEAAQAYTDFTMKHPTAATLITISSTVGAIVAVGCIQKLTLHQAYHVENLYYTK